MQHGEYEGYRGEGYEVEAREPETLHSYHHAPPTMPGEVIQGRPASAWPTVFGVIGIILAAWGILSTGCGAIMLAGVGGALGSMGGMGQQMQAAGLTGIAMIVGVLKLIVSMGLAVFLLVASIGVLKRTRSGADQMVMWSWARIVLGIIFLVLELATTNYGAVQQQGGGVPQGVLIGSIIFGVVIGLVFMLWFPVLNLIWFNRATIRAEVSQWS